MIEAFRRIRPVLLISGMFLIAISSAAQVPTKQNFQRNHRGSTQKSHVGLPLAMPLTVDIAIRVKSLADDTQMPADVQIQLLPPQVVHMEKDSANQYRITKTVDDGTGIQTLKIIMEPQPGFLPRQDIVLLRSNSKGFSRSLNIYLVPNTEGYDFTTISSKANLDDQSHYEKGLAFFEYAYSNRNFDASAAQYVAATYHYARSLKYACQNLYETCDLSRSLIMELRKIYPSKKSSFEKAHVSNDSLTTEIFDLDQIDYQQAAQHTRIRN